MDVLDFNRRFMRIEEELGLFPDTRMADPGWWDVVRYEVMKLAYNRMVGVGPDAPPPSTFAKRLRNLLTRWLLRAWLELRSRLRRHDVIVYRAPRLVRGRKRVDTAMDQVLGICPGRSLVIDCFPHKFDRRFASVHRLAARPAALDALEARIKDEFGLQLDLDEFVRHRLADHHLAFRHYRALLGRVRPRLVLLTQSGIEKALFRAARLANIPCIEVQHGLINGAHPAYAYPPSVSSAGLALFPDGLFAFSDFWLGTCHYPVRWGVAVGNDEFVPPPLPDPTPGAEILVITAIKYNDRLSEWMEAITPRLPHRTFKFKLHPSQAAYKPVVEARLSHLPNVQVVGTDRTVQQLMATASDVLLIQSTVAYEAAQAGRRLLVIDEMDSGTHADLFGLPNVHRVRNVDDLERILNAEPIAVPAPVFFKPFDAALALGILLRGAPPGHHATDSDAGAYASSGGERGILS